MHTFHRDNAETDPPRGSRASEGLGIEVQLGYSSDIAR